ncbi:transcriptional regulator [Bacillus altitudinis]|uniref:transcriptional regulator n=1 Tax=Bacillus TaxID=1386 RepID=UPI000587AAEF|nr:MULTISPECIES: transcriptional regulator [Bacillus]MEC0471155.1 transcriptional regulator [Bacillus altitudinis]
MGAIFNKLNNNPNERPKYTRYELAKLVKDKRLEKELSIEEVAAQFCVDPTLWESIESASRVFNSKIYTIISNFINVERKDLLKRDEDDLSTISYRSNLVDNDIHESVQLANAIFHEIVMQEKLGVE